MKVFRALALVAFSAPVWAWVAPASASSVGISPAALRVDGAMRGGEYRRSISVFTDTPAPMRLSLSESGQVAPWLTLFDVNVPTHPSTEVLVVPPGGNDGFVGVKITVPRDAADGTYTGTITMSAQATNANHAIGSVTLGGQVSVVVTVIGSQVAQGELVDAAPTAAEFEVGLPALFRIHIRNSGNVALDPHVTVVIVSNGRIVDRVQALRNPIPPGADGTVEALWDTRSAHPAAYTADISATAWDRPIGRRSASFRLLSAGTLRRGGEFRDLNLASAARSGGAAQVVAVFANSGQVDAEARFEGEIWRNGRRVQGVSSLPLRVDPGQLARLSFVVETSRPGDYAVSGFVDIGSTQTSTRRLTFRVGGGKAMGPVGFAIIAGAPVLATGAASWRRRQSRGRARKTASRS